MINPKLYKVRDGVKENLFMKNGFANKSYFYSLRKPLYKNLIFLTLMIDKDDHYMTVNIDDNGGNTYSPFYNPDTRHNNLVYEEVVEKYHDIMDGFVKNKILEYDTKTTNNISDAKTIKIKYFTDKIERIKKIENGDWIDLRAAEDMELKAGEFKLIPLGVAMQLPEGYEAHIVPRSSTYKNFGIIQTNHQAVIDESYCGDNDQWFYPAYALRDTVIHVNDRICQFRIMQKQPELSFEVVDTLGNKDRGGIGSTGKQ